MLLRRDISPAQKMAINSLMNRNFTQPANETAQEGQAWTPYYLHNLLIKLCKYVEIFKNIFSRKKICKGKIGIYWNILPFNMESWKLISFSMDMCWSCPMLIEDDKRIQVGGWGEPECTQGAQVFFPLGGGWRCWIFFYPIVFLSSSQWVPNMFPIAPHFIPYPLQ